MYRRLLKMFLDSSIAVGEDFILGLDGNEREMTTKDSGMYVGMLGLVKVLYVDKLKELGVRIPVDNPYFLRGGKGIVECYVNSQEVVPLDLGDSRSIEEQMTSYVADRVVRKRREMEGVV